MAGDNLDDEFVGDENEIAAALERNERAESVSATERVFDPKEKMDFADVELPKAEDIMPLDMSERKIFGEPD